MNFHLKGIQVIAHQNHLFTLKVKISKNFQSSNHLAPIILASYPQASHLGFAYCLQPNSITRLRCSHQSLLLYYVKTMHYSAYENDPLFSWPTFSLWIRRKEKVAISNNQSIIAIAFQSYYGWDSNYQIVDESHQNLRIACFDQAMAKRLAYKCISSINFLYIRV